MRDERSETERPPADRDAPASISHPSSAILADHPFAGTCVLLVRHGETQWNLDQRVQGHYDVPLTERGVEQARRLAASLEEVDVAAVYSSDLQRCLRTAEIVAAARVPVVADPRFREARFGTFEGLTLAEIGAKYPEEFRAWRTDAVRHRPPGGETLEDLGARCMAGLREALSAHAGRTVVVVSHGGPVRMMTCGLLELPISVYPRLRVENASVARILFTARGAILAGFNDTSHLRTGSAAPRHAGWEEK